MHKYHFSNALNYSHKQLSQMHNASFQGYYVPIDMTAETSADFWRVNNIDASRSVVLLDQDEIFVGFARMGTRGKRGWCGGFGIVPEYRGSGASRLLAERMVEVARSTGLEMLQLEVLSQNTRASKLYERIGFTHQRRLIGLEIAVTQLESAPVLALEHVSLYQLLPALMRGVRPVWAYEPASLLSMSLEAYCLPESTGGLIVQRANGNARIVATAELQNLTTQELSAVLRQVAGDALTLQIYNEPEESPLLSPYANLGFTEIFSQNEMFLKL